MPNPLESKFKSQFLSEFKRLYPECVIIGPDANLQQGLPDTIILFGEKWAALEFKRSSTASRRPNQEYYINLLGNMSYSAFVCPENKEEVLHALQHTFQLRG